MAILVDALKEAVIQAAQCDTHMQGGLACQTPGMICTFYRHLFSALGSVCNEILEAGALAGASAVAFGYQTECHVTSIDDYSLWPTLADVPESIWEINKGEAGRDRLNCWHLPMADTYRRYTTAYEVDATLIEKSWQSVAFMTLPRPDVVYYDADHSYEATKAFLTHVIRLWSPLIVLVDDTLSDEVTRAIQSTPKREHYRLRFPYWNGLYAGVWST